MKDGQNLEYKNYNNDNNNHQTWNVIIKSLFVKDINGSASGFLFVVSQT
jgi:hypothetical protein